MSATTTMGITTIMVTAIAMPRATATLILMLTAMSIMTMGTIMRMTTSMVTMTMRIIMSTVPAADAAVITTMGTSTITDRP